MNKTIKYLMISDIFLLTGFGLIDPILAIFIKDELIGGTIFRAGLASTLFLITKCVVQLPFAKYVDNHSDKVKWLIIGTCLIATVPSLYIFAKDINMIYIAQVIHGIGSGLAYPTWLGLWSAHLDKKHESFEWSLYSTFTGIGTAATASIGAALAQFFGFSVSFMLGGIMGLVGCVVLFRLEQKNHHKDKEVDIMHYHRKRFIHKKH